MEQSSGTYSSSSVIGTAAVGVLGAVFALTGCSDPFSSCEARRRCPSDGGSGGEAAPAEAGRGGTDAGRGGVGGANPQLPSGESGAGGADDTPSAGEGGSPNVGGTGGEDPPFAAGAGAGGQPSDTEKALFDSVHPRDGARDVERDVTLEISFDAAVTTDDADRIEVILDGEVVPGTLSANSSVISFDAERPFALLGTYTITVDGEEVSSFTVRDGQWTTPRLLDIRESSVPTDVSVGFSNQNYAVATWIQDGDVWASRWLANTFEWEAPVRIDARSAPARVADLSFDPAGNALVAWHEEPNTYLLARYTTRWVEPAVSALEKIFDGPKVIAVASAAPGEATLVWSEGVLSGSTITAHEIYASDWSEDSGWSAPEVLAANSGIALFDLVPLSGGLLTAWGIRSQSDGAVTYQVESREWKKGVGWAATQSVHGVGTSSLNGFLVSTGTDSVVLGWGGLSFPPSTTERFTGHFTLRKNGQWTSAVALATSVYPKGAVSANGASVVADTTSVVRFSTEAPTDTEQVSAYQALPTIDSRGNIAFATSNVYSTPSVMSVFRWPAGRPLGEKVDLPLPTNAEVDTCYSVPGCARIASGPQGDAVFTFQLNGVDEVADVYVSTFQ